MIGVDHRSCPPGVRERMASEPFETPRVLERLRTAGLREALWLSTCDRVEVLALTAADEATAAAAAITTLLAERAGLPPDGLTVYLKYYEDTAAIRHLLAITASLESQVIGEPQVTGQVKAALAASRDARLTGSTLEALVQTALQTAKQVRNQTRIGERPTSIAAAAVQTARTLHGALDRCRGLLLGTGDLGALLVEPLTTAGLTTLTVIAPSSARAEALAHRLNGHFALMDDLDAALTTSDIVITAVGNGRYQLTPDAIQAALRRRRRRPMLILDTAIPADVDPAVAHLPSAFVYDLNDLERQALAGRAGREAETDAAWRLVDAATSRLIRAQAARNAAPLVSRLRQHFEATRRAVLHERPDADAGTATRLLINRLLHSPSTALRAHAAAGLAADQATLEDATRRLFDLRPDDGTAGPEPPDEWGDES